MSVIGAIDNILTVKKLSVNLYQKTVHSRTFLFVQIEQPLTQDIFNFDDKISATNPIDYIPQNQDSRCHFIQNKLSNI
jgi:hypothetical protein